MTAICPYCGNPIDMTEVSESGLYRCPYEGCSKIVAFDKTRGALCEPGSQNESRVAEKTTIRCPNPSCRQELRIPTTGSTLQIVCPECGICFRRVAHGEDELPDADTLLIEFDKALDDEIKAVKTHGGNKTIALKDGKIVREIAGEKVYQFSLARKIPVADESPALIQITGKDYRASVVRFLDFKLEIRIADFDGEKIPSALLKLDATFVLRKLREALPLMKSRPLNVDLALKTFNYRPQRCCIGKPVFTLFDKEGRQPDIHQAEAIETCLGNEVSFVHGPPGTGKTRTLANVVNDFANNAMKVLVACHTNIACDNAVEHFIRYDHEKSVADLLADGKVVRIGTPVKKDRSITDLTIDEIHRRLTGELQEERQELTQLLESLNQRSSREYECKQICLECKKIAETISNCEERIQDCEDVIERCRARQNKLTQSIGEKQKLLTTAESRHPIINFLAGTRPKVIRLELEELNAGRTAQDVVLSGQGRRLSLLSAEREKLGSSLEAKTKKLPSELDTEGIEKAIKETNVALEQTRLWITHVDEKVSKLSAGVMENAMVVVTTLAKTFTDPVLEGIRFDIVVIDEASIAPLPMIFFVSSLARKKVVVFGDPRQLAPIKLANTAAADRWLKKDIFQEASADEGRAKDPRIRTLRKQYRMHQEIFSIVNANFYDNELENGKPMPASPCIYDDLYPASSHRVAVIDSANANACMSTEKMGPKSWSRYNLYHVQLLEKVLRELIDGNGLKQADIGVITPYRSQAGFAREMLSDCGFNEIDVGTVHSFQGLEKDYVIFDLVEAPGGKRVSGLVNDAHDVHKGKPRAEVDALRLHTVAFSRPKEKLLLICHTKHMLNNLPGSSVLRKIISDLSNRGATVDGSEIIPYYVPADEYPDATLFSREELSSEDAVFNQKSFYPHLVMDLSEAKDEVFIVSGYMSARRMEKLLPHLSELISRNVTVRILTKPPREQMSREQDLEELHDRLTKMGIEVYQYYGTHEKIVGIDRHILYAGSLNVLSFNHGSKEMMIRTDSKHTFQKVFSVLAKNYPRLEEYLVRTGYVASEQPIDLTPERFGNVLESVRPKHRETPKNAQEARDYYTSMFTKLRWVIADDKRRPNFSVLFRKTIKAMLDSPPQTVEQLLSLPEFVRNRTGIKGYEKIVLGILREYAQAVGINWRA